MGLGSSNLIANTPLEQDETDKSYVVPTWVPMSAVQTSTMMEYHLTNGVPFRIQENGDSRPKGLVKQVVLLESDVKLHRTSLSAVCAGRNGSILRFRYDAKVPVVMSMSFYTSKVDGSTGFDPQRVKQRKLRTHYPVKFLLPAGINRVWDSSNKAHVEAVYHGSIGFADVSDVPTDASSSSDRSGQVAADLYKTFRLFSKAHATFAQMDVSEIAEAGNKKSKSGKKRKSPSRDNDLYLYLSPVFDVAEEGATRPSPRPSSGLSRVTTEVSRFGMIGMTTIAAPDTGSSSSSSNEAREDWEGPSSEVDRAPKALTFRCTQQQIVVDGVTDQPYTVHEVYGVCHEKVQMDQDADGELTVGAVKLAGVNPPLEDNNNNDNDNDSSDCVICLCEPREFACLPCRHLSMCSNCVVDLTSHGNKCPICRKKTETFLKIPVTLYNPKVAAQALAASGGPESDDETKGSE